MGTLITIRRFFQLYFLIILQFVLNVVKDSYGKSIVVRDNGTAAVVDDNQPKSGDETEKKITQSTPTAHPPSQQPSDSDGNGDYLSTITTDPDLIRRMLYVMLGITLIVILIFVYRTVRGKGRRKTKKYGVLATPNTEVELRPLDEDDDDEDVTVFDASK